MASEFIIQTPTVQFLSLSDILHSCFLASSRNIQLATQQAKQVMSYEKGRTWPKICLIVWCSSTQLWRRVSGSRITVHAVLYVLCKNRELFSLPAPVWEFSRLPFDTSGQSFYLVCCPTTIMYQKYMVKEESYEDFPGVLLLRFLSSMKCPGQSYRVHLQCNRCFRVRHLFFLTLLCFWLLTSIWEDKVLSALLPVWRFVQDQRVKEKFSSGLTYGCVAGGTLSMCRVLPSLALL